MAVSSKTVFEVADIVATVVVYKNHNHFFFFFSWNRIFPDWKRRFGGRRLQPEPEVTPKPEIFVRREK